MTMVAGRHLLPWMRTTTTMETLRRRVPYNADEEQDTERILDEQEQEEVVEALRKANNVANEQYHILIPTVIGLSIAAQLLYLFTPSKRTPIANIFPLQPSADPSPIPLSTILTLITILAQLDVALYSKYARGVVNKLPSEVPQPLPFDMVYATSAVGPALSLFLGKPWQTTVWWCLSPFIVYVTQTVVESIQAGNHNVSELEGMRYRAPGA